MPKGPMNLPGPFGAMNGQVNSTLSGVNNAFSDPKFQPLKDQINSTMTNTVQPMLNKMTSGVHLPPQIQAMIQSLMGGASGNSPSPMPTAPSPQAPPPVVGGGFWHGSPPPTYTPNSGITPPPISNTPSTTSPVSPFAMQQLPANVKQAGMPTGNKTGGGMFSAPNFNTPWASLPAPPVRGTAITGP